MLDQSKELIHFILFYLPFVTNKHYLNICGKGKKKNPKNIAQYFHSTTLTPFVALVRGT
jgi:hypothetical protein